MKIHLVVDNSVFLKIVAAGICLLSPEHMMTSGLELQVSYVDLIQNPVIPYLEDEDALFMMVRNDVEVEPLINTLALDGRRGLIIKRMPRVSGSQIEERYTNILHMEELGLCYRHTYGSIAPVSYLSMCAEFLTDQHKPFDKAIPVLPYTCITNFNVPNFRGITSRYSYSVLNNKTWALDLIMMIQSGYLDDPSALDRWCRVHLYTDEVPVLYPSDKAMNAAMGVAQYLQRELRHLYRNAKRIDGKVIIHAPVHNFYYWANDWTFAKEIGDPNWLTNTIVLEVDYVSGHHQFIDHLRMSEGYSDPYVYSTNDLKELYSHILETTTNRVVIEYETNADPIPVFTN